MYFLKNFIKTIYASIVVIMVALASWTIFTGSNPIDEFTKVENITAKSFEIKESQWNPTDQALITPDGNIKIHSYETAIGANFMDEKDKKILIIFYNFESKKDKARPYAIWNKYITAEQDGKELHDGTLNKKNESKKYNDFLNNSILFYNKGESTESTQVYSYDSKGGPITINYGNETFVYDINKK